MVVRPKKQSNEIDLAREPDPKNEETALTHAEQHSKLLLSQFQQDIDERKNFSKCAYRMTRIWVIFLVVITFFQWTSRLFNLGLRPEEFIAVITTTTASVFGFWWLVGRYLFKGPEKPPKS